MSTRQAVLELPANLDPSKMDKVRNRMLNPFLMRLYTIVKLPLGAMAGLRVDALDERRCEVSLPYGWRSQNPFRSIYFAAQSMAAEMSTGAPAMMATEMASKPVAMLIVDLEAEFTKKANQRTTFTCEMVPDFFAAVDETVRTGEPVKVKALTVGRMADGTEVSRFTFTWSLKRRG